MMGKSRLITATPHIWQKNIRKVRDANKARKPPENLKLKIIKIKDPETAKVLEQILIYLLKT